MRFLDKLGEYSDDTFHEQYELTLGYEQVKEIMGDVIEFYRNKESITDEETPDLYRIKFEVSKFYQALGIDPVSQVKVESIENDDEHHIEIAASPQFSFEDLEEILEEDQEIVKKR